MKEKIKFLIPLLFLTILVTGINVFAATPEAEENQVLNLVNKERAAVGAPALQTTDELQAVADIRARELVSDFSHFRPDGTSCFTALDGTLIGQLAIYAGENIAIGYGNAESVMNGWMNSPGHKSNILDADYTHIGIGCYEEGGIRYWVQMFVTRYPYTGMLENSAGWWYLTDGEIDRSYEGMAQNEYGWWYIKNGTVDWSFTGMAQNPYGWWYLTNGAVDWNYEGMAENPMGWWYIKNGTVDWNFTGMAQNPYGWWYLTNGGVDWYYEGMAQNLYGWWYISNGTVDWNYQGMAENIYGWWYIKNGTVDWSYTGMAQNPYGWWYLTNGGVDWSYTGQAEHEGHIFDVVNGYAGI